jgi:hypothetical protein
MNCKVLVSWVISCFVVLQAGWAQQSMTLGIECQDSRQGGTICVKFTSTEISQLNSLSFTVGYDPAVLRYTDDPILTSSCINSLQKDNFTSIPKNGFINIVWVETPLDVSANCELFTLCFDVIGTAGDHSEISINGRGVDIVVGSEVGDVKLISNPCKIKVTSPQLEINTKYCNQSAAGANDASLTILGNSGRGPYTFEVKNNTTGAVVATGSHRDGEPAVVSNLPPGTYRIDLTDAQGANKFKTVGISAGDIGKPSFDIEAFNPSCTNLATPNGVINLKNINVTNVPYTVKWSSGEFNEETVKFLPNGNYTITVTDNNGCSVTKSALLNRDTLKLDLKVLDNADCAGKNGWVELKGSGGVPFSTSGKYEYNVTGFSFIAPSANPFLFFQAKAGMNKFSIRDNAVNFLGNKLQCVVTDSIFVPKYFFPNQYMDTILTHVKCFGENDGKVVLELNDAGKPYSIVREFNSISNIDIPPGGVLGGGASTNFYVHENLAPGSYGVITRTNSGCEDTMYYAIKGPSTRFRVSPTIVQPSCNGLGSIDAITTGGVSPYIFRWHDGNTTSTRTNLLAGTYSVTITDAAGCDTTFTSILNPIGQGAGVTAAIVKAVSCPGKSDGEVTVNVNTTSTNITYDWKNAAGTTVGTTKSVTGLPIGVYRVAVTIDGCTESSSVILAAPVGLSVSSIQLNVAECPRGGNKGSIGLTVAGGVSPYNFVWTKDGSNTPIGNQALLPAIDPGKYKVKVLDSQGCSVDTAATLAAPRDFVVTLQNKTGITCAGVSNASATVKASLGPANNGSYTFVWSNGRRSSGGFDMDINTTLSGGKNWVIATDAKCFSDTFHIVIEDKLPISLVKEIKPICKGTCSGEIKITASGGEGTYVYKWPSINNASTNLVSNLCVGSYPLSVKDRNGCEKRDTIILVPSDSITLALDNEMTILLSCRNTVGQIAVKTIGGKLPFTYTWANTVSTSAIAKGLVQGTYSVTVTDASGCTDSVSLKLDRPNAVTATVTAPPVTTCFGGTSCILVTNVQGGVGGNYTMQINNGPRIPTDSCLQQFAGNYLVSVYDALGCKADYKVTIGQPEPISVDLGKDVEVNLGESLPPIKPIIDAKFKIAKYIWKGLSDSLKCANTECSEIEGFPSRDVQISLEIIDENGCKAKDDMAVTVKDERRVYFPNTLSLSSGNDNSVFDVKIGFGVQIVEEFTIFDRWGNIVYKNQNYIPENGVSGWRGEFGSDHALPGVYVFGARIRFIDGVVKNYAGDVTLVK